MAIVNQYGQTISSGQLFEGAKRQPNRKHEPVVLGDFDSLFTEYDWQTLASMSQKIYSNFGIIKGAIDQKSSYAVGRAFIPIYKGQDKEWGSAASEWLAGWYKICDVKGGVFDFQTNLYLFSLSIDIFGDCFVLLTESETGYPQIQAIPAHKIGNRGNETEITKGFYRGFKISKGIIYNKKTRAVAYKILGAANDGSQDIIVSYQSLLHVYDPSYVDATRGIPAIAHGINELRDVRESMKRELFNQVLMSSIGFIEHNESGTDESPMANLYGGSGASASTGLNYSTLEEGMIRYFQAGTNSKIEQVANMRPSPEWQSFQTRLIRGVLAGIPWSHSIVEPESNGVGNRAELIKCSKTVEDRQSLMIPLANKIISYALSKAITRGDLPLNNEFYKWGFTLPRKLTLDMGRESAARISEYEAGFTTLSDVVGENGEQLDSHIDQKINEQVLIAKKIQAAEKEHEIKINPKTILGILNDLTDNNLTQ